MRKKEYVITLKNKDDLPGFYDNMETVGGSLSIPNRAIPVKNRRPISRNTTYLLTEFEAKKISKDPRVLSVELTFEEQGIKFKPNRSETSTLWNKSNTISTGHRNWGLLRCVEGATRSNWGSNGTTNVTGTINLTSTGKHVDAVVVDGHFDPTHAEFAVNADGTGASRVVQFNWLSLNPQVTGGSAGTYVYTPYVDIDPDATSNNNHGAAVAGVFVGNTRGWASDANIYNLNPYSTNPNTSVPFYLIDYLRAWHNSKPINPVTGRRNPTISNHSYGGVIDGPITSISQVRFRGVLYTGPFTPSQLSGFGIFNYDSGGGVYVAEFPVRSNAFDADLLDAIDDGIIVIAAAGNQFTKIDNFSDDPSADYNNYLVSGGFQYYYNEGSTLATPGVIQVGAIAATVSETKATYSNCGPRVDVYAPGSFIMTVANTGSGFVNDARDPTDRWTKINGTSFSSPQVAGALACLSEQWPTMTQAQALRYITENAKVDQIADTEGGPGDNLSLQGSENRYLYYVKERQEQGQITPRSNQGFRPTSGLAWPRPRIYRYGR
jgi:hypothetical protein